MADDEHVKIESLDTLTKEQAQKYLEHYSDNCVYCTTRIFGLSDENDLHPQLVLIKLTKKAESDYDSQCPTEKLLDDFAANYILPHTAVEIASHLGNCDHCFAHYNDELLSTQKKVFAELEKGEVGKAVGRWFSSLPETTSSN